MLRACLTRRPRACAGPCLTPRCHSVAPPTRRALNGTVAALVTSMKSFARRPTSQNRDTMVAFAKPVLQTFEALVSYADGNPAFAGAWLAGAWRTCRAGRSQRFGRLSPADASPFCWFLFSGTPPTMSTQADLHAKPIRAAALSGESRPALRTARVGARMRRALGRMTVAAAHSLPPSQWRPERPSL